MTSDPRELVDRLLGGDDRALARAISIVEDRLPSARDVVKNVYARAGRAPVVGVTGPPGAGKSTLVDALTGLYRSAGKKIGIVAIDPSSTFSGGAVLGDRVRMQRHSSDPGVFIRSMATRGNFGGLAATTVDVIDLLDAWGADLVVVETVGVGQDEVDVVGVADVVLVVLVPGLGDDIQTIKAGIMEIPDLFVLNKADREGVDRLHTEVKAMLSLAETDEKRSTSIVRTVATTGDGMEDLRKGIDSFLENGGDALLESRRERRGRDRLLNLMRERVLEWAASPSSHDLLDKTVAEVVSRSLDPYTAADRLLQKFSPPGRPVV